MLTPKMKMEAPQTWFMTGDAKASSKWLSTNVHMVSRIPKPDLGNLNIPVNRGNT